MIRATTLTPLGAHDMELIWPTWNVWALPAGFGDLQTMYVFLSKKVGLLLDLDRLQYSGPRVKTVQPGILISRSGMYRSARMWTTFDIHHLSEKEPLGYCVLILLHRQGVKRVLRLVCDVCRGMKTLLPRWISFRYLTSFLKALLPTGIS